MDLSIAGANLMTRIVACNALRSIANARNGKSNFDLCECLRARTLVELCRGCEYGEKPV